MERKQTIEKKTTPDIAAHIFVYGRVQGVGFRSWAASRASQLGITGWVQNCPDYSVEIFAEGSMDIVQTYIDILKEGDTWAYVESVTVDRTVPRGYTRFSIE